MPLARFGWMGVRGAAMKVHALSLSLSDARVVVFLSTVVSRHRDELKERCEGFVISATDPTPREIHSLLSRSKIHQI